jgi:hypothetical protein
MDRDYWSSSLGALYYLSRHGESEEPRYHSPWGKVILLVVLLFLLIARYF